MFSFFSVLCKFFICFGSVIAFFLVIAASLDIPSAAPSSQSLKFDCCFSVEFNWPGFSFA